MVYRIARPQVRQMAWTMLLIYWATVSLPYFTVEVYFSGAVLRMSAPFKASRPVWEKYYSTGPFPSIGEYIRAERLQGLRRWSSPSMPVRTP